MKHIKQIPFIAALFLVSSVQAVAQPNPATQTAVEPSAAQADAISLEGTINLRDPFRRPKLKTSTDLAEGGNIPELERFQLDEFKLVGVITGAKKNKALLTSPAGKMFIVSENMHIGTRRGLVKRILPSGLSVEEKVVNLLGQEEKVETVIEFKKKEKL